MAASMAVTVKMRLPHTMAEAWPRPGSSIFHVALEGFQSVVTFCSMEVPSLRGPRQPGQFSAWAVSVMDTSSKIKHTGLFIGV